MKLFFWQGPERELGRFGLVRKNDPLMLTANEAEYVTKHKDRNYRPGKTGEAFPDTAPDHLKSQADTEHVFRLELREASHHQLLAMCGELRARGHQICFDLRSSRSMMTEAILNARRNPPPAKPQLATEPVGA